jgi:hypothetical protein
MTFSSVTATASAIMVMSTFAAALGKLLNLFQDFFKHFLPLFFFGVVVCFFKSNIVNRKILKISPKITYKAFVLAKVPVLLA